MIQKAKEWKSNSVKERVIKSINNCSRKYYWSYKVHEDYFGTQLDHNKTLLITIQQANYGFGGDTLIASSEAIAIMDDMLVYDDGDIINSTFYKIGYVDEFKVYVDKYLFPCILIVKSDFFTSSDPECVVIYIRDLP